MRDVRAEGTPHVIASGLVHLGVRKLPGCGITCKSEKEGQARYGNFLRQGFL